MPKNYTYYVTENNKTTGYDYKEFENYLQQNGLCYKATDDSPFSIAVFDYTKFGNMVNKLRKGTKYFFTECNVFIEAKKDR